MMSPLTRHTSYLRKSVAIVGSLAMYATAASGQLPAYQEAPSAVFPSVFPGTSTRLIVKSDSLGDDMTVDVWFPPSYGSKMSARFPVIYTFDGQNLFDPSLSFANVAWELDKTAAVLADKGEIKAPIIVGIHNRGAKNLRPNDYFPEKALRYIAESEKESTMIWETCPEGFNGDKHAAFVALELKPLIDYLYNTSTDVTHTFALGSSMGALASLYLLCEYPEIFGGVGCMSTHWIGSFNLNPDYTLYPDPICADAVLAYFDENLPEPKQRKLYFDQGTTGWDAEYLPYESDAREIAARHRYHGSDGTLMTFDAIGAGHNEWFWQQRAERPLKFLLGDLSSSVEVTEIGDNGSSDILYNLQGFPVVGHPSSGIYIRNGKKVLIK